MIIWQCLARRHGNLYAYEQLGCRCPDAVAAKRLKGHRQAPGRYVRGRWSPGRPAGGPDDIDDVAVDRAIGGDRTVQLNTSERQAAIDELDRRGHSASQIARRLGTTTRTVVRYRRRRTPQPA